MRPITARKVRQVLLSILFGAVIGAGLMAIGIARSHADPWTPDPVAVRLANMGAGKTVCGGFAKLGVSIDSVENIGNAAVETLQITVKQAVDLELYSVETFCPQYMSELMALANQEPSKEIQPGRVV